MESNRSSRRVDIVEQTYIGSGCWTIERFDIAGRSQKQDISTGGQAEKNSSETTSTKQGEPMARHSKRLEEIAKQDDRIDFYEFDGSTDDGIHWLHLSCGNICAISETHSCTGRTVKETLEELASVEDCGRECCGF